MHSLRTPTLLKKDSCEICEILKTLYFTEYLPWLLLTVSGFQRVTLLKKRLPQRCFFVYFANFLRTSFNRTPLNDSSEVYLWISRSFLERLIYRAPLRICLFHVQVAEFQPGDTVDNYFIGAFCAFHAFYTRTRRSHSKAFIFLKSLKIICEEVNLYWSYEMPTCKFTKNTLSRIPLHIIFAFIFWERITITFFPRGF